MSKLDAACERTYSTLNITIKQSHKAYSNKEHFTALYNPVSIKDFTPRQIKDGFAACGLYPFNLDQVFKTMTKPRKMTVSEIDKVMVELSRSVKSFQLKDAELHSPTAPVSAEGIASLQNMIVQQSTHVCREANRWRIQRPIHRLVEAAQMSFAKAITDSIDLKQTMVS